MSESKQTFAGIIREEKIREIETCVATLSEIREASLTIPIYQRKYSWGEKQIRILLEDIKGEIEQNEKQPYLMGSLILYRNEEKELEIVDGQQRLITLHLILEVLISEGLKKENSKDSEENLIFKKGIEKFRQENQDQIKENQKYIEKWLQAEGINIGDWKGYILDNLEFVCVFAPNLDDAFIFFDSANSKGKKLEDYDLIKAYHLREFESSSKSLSLEYYAKEFESLNQKDFFKDLMLILPALRQWTKRLQKLKDLDEINAYDEFCQELPRSLKTSFPLLCKNLMGMLQNFSGGSDFFDYLFECEKLYQKIDSLKFYQELCKIGGSGMLYLRYLYTMAMMIYLDKFPNGKIDTFAPLIARVVYSYRITNSRIYQATIREASKEILPLIYYASFEEELENSLRERASKLYAEEEEAEEKKKEEAEKEKKKEKAEKTEEEKKKFYSGEQELRDILQNLVKPSFADKQTKGGNND